MRILMLTQWFQPEPMFKGLSFAEELHRRGHEVEILTGFPNYPGGKVYDGYRIKPWQREEMNGIRVNRVALYPSHNNSVIGRIANYVSFSLMTLLVGPWLISKPDVIYVYNLVTLSRTASLLRWLYGCKIVYDVQDLWPESVVSSGMLSGFLHKILKGWCYKAYQRVDFIVAQSPGFQENLQKRGIPDKKIGVIYNWGQEENVFTRHSAQGIAQTLGEDRIGTFNVVFAGTMGVMQGLGTVLDTAKILAENHPEIRLLLVGDGIEKNKLQERSNILELDNVLFVPRQPMSAMGRVFDLADALLVHLKTDPLFKITIPSKTQSYLAAGKPIVMAMEGDAADLVERAGAGYTCHSENPQAMAECISKLSGLSGADRKRMGENGKDFYNVNLSFLCGVNKFEAIFKSLI